MCLMNPDPLFMLSRQFSTNTAVSPFNAVRSSFYEIYVRTPRIKDKFSGNYIILSKTNLPIEFYLKAITTE